MDCFDVNLNCNDDARRGVLELHAPPNNGIKAVEVAYNPWPPTQATVCSLKIYFFDKIPAGLDNISAKDQFAISGGVRIPGPSLHIIGIAAVNQNTPDEHLELMLDSWGDHSQYVLTINGAGLDPLFQCRPFFFTIICDNPFDCEQPAAPPAPLPPDPAIDYLARDYQSFRRALLEFLPTRLPGYTESNEADLAVTLAELFSHAGDNLTYYQDTVNNELFFGTARQRSSVKRHARLVDYQMHDGLAARTLLQFNVDDIGKVTVPVPDVGLSWSGAETDEVDHQRIIHFENEEPVDCWHAHNARPGIAPYTWLNTQCCLPKGSTHIDLDGHFSHLATGVLLLIEERLAPYTALQGGGAEIVLEAPPNPEHRQIIRISRAEYYKDSLNPAGVRDVTRVFWEDVDALRFDFCLESDAIGQPATTASANLARASHGTTVCGEALVATAQGLMMAQGPLTWLSPAAGTSETWLFPPDPIYLRRSRSTVSFVVNGHPWTERQTLLDSNENDTDFVVDVDDQGRGTIRTGDGRLGAVLLPTDVVTFTYRVGNGVVGNVAAETLTRPASGFPAAVYSVRNPLPAVFGTEPEAIVDVRRDAPQAFRAVQYRAVTAADYAAAATLVKGVAHAAASFRWTGSWLTVFVSVQPHGTNELSDQLRQAVVTQLDSYRQAGYDLEIQPADFIALDIELEVCILPGYFQADVLRDVFDVLSSGLRRDGTPGFFYPDNFTFGQSLYLSQLYAAVQSVPGVRAVQAFRLKRLHERDYGELGKGQIAVGPFEIVRLDNDPSMPDNGLLVIDGEGGK